MESLVHEPVRRRPWAYVVGSLVALVAAAAIALAIGVFIGRGKLQAKLAAIGDRFGLRIEVGAVDLPLVGAIGARDVRIYGRAGVLVATVDRIETDLTLADAALGATRPGRIELHGGEVRVRLVDGQPVDLAPPETAAATSTATGPSEPLSLGLGDLRLVVEARHATPWGEIEAVPIDLRVAELEVARDADRQVSAAVRGVWQVGPDAVPFEAHIDTRARSLRATLDGDAHLGLATPWGPVWIGIRSFGRDARRAATSVSGLDVVRGDDRLRAGSIEVTGGGDGWIPDPRGLTSVAVDGLDARHDARVFAALRAVIGLEAEPGYDLPSPTSLALTDARGEAPDPVTGGALRAEAHEVTLGLRAVRASLAAGSILDALTEVRLVRPKATLVVPRAAESDTPAAAPDAAPAAPEPDPDPTTLLLGQDDVPPPSAAPRKDEPRTGFAFLDRLFGDPKADSAGGPMLADFLPTALRERAAALVPRLRVLKPVVKDGSLEVIDTQGKSLVALEGAGLEAAETDDGLLSLALRAAVLRSGKETGRADVRVAMDDAGAIQWVEGTLAGTDLANRLARFVPGLAVQPDAELDLDIRYDRPRTPTAPHHVAGTIRVANFTFEFWRISDREVRDLQGAATFDLIVDRKGRRLVLNLPELKMGDARFSASLDLTKPPKKLPSFTTRLSMARQDCGKAAASIPKALIPNLSTLEMAGEMNFDASLVLDLENPRDLELKVDGDVTKCRVLSLGPGIDLEALKGDFVHHPREPGRGVLEHIAVGRGTNQWLPSERIPELLKLAAWVTEDRAWTQHAGVRWGLVATALKIDLTNGRFVYGGSTITQQLVKNLYLTRTKNLARKLEEAIIAMQMERVLTKDEILTIYVNCIEYGPDIYGLKHAASFYFDKKVGDLDGLEAAFIMGLKPFPKAGHRQWQKGALDEFWVRRIGYVLQLMAKYGPDLITAEEAAAFAPYQPKFRPP